MACGGMHLLGSFRESNWGHFLRAPLEQCWHDHTIMFQPTLHLLILTMNIALRYEVPAELYYSRSAWYVECVVVLGEYIPLFCMYSLSSFQSNS